MLPGFDPSLPAATVSIAVALLAAWLHRLFRTGLSFWASVAAAALSIYAISACIVTYQGAASAIADLSILVAGFSAYAASRWLKWQFELVADHVP